MNREMVLGVIPSRYASQRFPGKPLIDILGKSMIQRVYEQALKAKYISKLVVATDDDRIFKTVKNFGGNVEMTSNTINNGTERTAVLAEKWDYSLIVNIQGDEPLIDPHAIDKAIKLLFNNDSAVASTLVKKIDNIPELNNPNLPKVILDNRKNALYFSRLPIPYCRDCKQQEDWLKHHSYFRHIGLYVYRSDFLKKYVHLPETPLERIEKLEQLRIIENGFHIKVAVVDYAPLGIDTPNDLEKLIQFLKVSGFEKKA